VNVRFQVSPNYLGAVMKRWKLVVFAACVLVMYGSLASATEVSLYTESDFQPGQNQLRVRVFADITDVANGGALLSAGFVLNYDGGLTNPVAEKNVFDWFFGNSSDSKAYIEPDTTRDGEVIFLLGKIDENNPTQGISGYRVLLGSVLFDYSGSSPTAADLGLTDGHPGSFADFVTTKGTVLDKTVSYTVAKFRSTDSLQLQSVIRALQLLSGIEKIEPVRVAPDDITGDGKIDITEPLYLLQKIAH
jgi:hypothetical protein